MITNIEGVNTNGAVGSDPNATLLIMKFTLEIGDKEKHRIDYLRWTPKTGPQVKMDFCWSAGEKKADYESKTQTA